VARWQGSLIPVAASFGLAQMTATDTLTDTIELADQSMYRLKRERCGGGQTISGRSAAAAIR